MDDLDEIINDRIRKIVQEELAKIVVPSNQDIETIFKTLIERVELKVN